MTKPNTVRKVLNWSDDPRKDHYIDDNALFLLLEIGKETFSPKGRKSGVFLWKRPIEWSQLDLVNFLVQASEAYGFTLSDFSTNVSAFSEEYELDLFDKKTGVALPQYADELKEYSKRNKEYDDCMKRYEAGEVGFLDCFYYYVVPPRHYFGAYKWALDESEKDTKRGKLLKKIFNNTNNTYSREDFNEIRDMYWLVARIGGSSPGSYQNQIAKDILSWTEFSIELTPEISQKLRADLIAYIDKFIKGELWSGERHRRLESGTVLMSEMTYSFERSREILREHFIQMSKDYGQKFTIVNPFDEGYEERVTSISDRYASRKFLFVHSLFAMHILKEIGIVNLGNNWHHSEKEPTRATAYVEMLSLPVSAVEKRAQDGMEPGSNVPETTTESRFLSTELKEKATFFIEMTDEGQVILNEKYKLSKPRFGGENSNFIDFCLKYGDRFSVTKSQKIETFDFKKSPHGILDDLGFRPEIKKIFFPKSTREGIEFRNYLSQEEIDELQIDKKKLKTELRGLKQLRQKEMEIIRNDKKRLVLTGE